MVMISNTNVNYNSQGEITRTAKSELGKDDFLKLLVTQLRYQDPSNPMQDRDFIAQMAQFSSLEQTKNMTDELKKFTESQNAFMNLSVQNQGANFLGKEVTGVLDLLDKDGNPVKDKNDQTVTQEVTGVVQGYKVVDGKIVLSVNGINIAMERVNKVNQGPQSNYQMYPQWASFIGKTVSGQVAPLDENGKVSTDSNGKVISQAMTDVKVSGYKVVNGQPVYEVTYKDNAGQEKKGQLLQVDTVR